MELNKDINTEKTIDSKHKRLSIIVPCYNEEKGINHLYNNLTPVLDKLENNWAVELLFIDDGSTDNTNHLLTEQFKGLKNVKIIRHKKNMNLGAAMRTGFTNSTGDVIVTMDSDCTYSPSEIFALLDMLDENTDIVTASPYHPDGKVDGVPEYRLFLSKSITWIYRLITGAKIYTFTALFRAQRKNVIDNIKFESNNFLATAEMLIYALMKGYRVKEFPTTLHVRKYGVSKMKLLLVIKSHAKFVLKLLQMRLNGKLRNHKK
ncbi:MAG: glycosyltransferase family 2 protein [Candidatus Woesearchaeota archaeon]